MYRAKPGDGAVWITGASSGIGRQVALDLAVRGFTVVVTARRRAELEALAAEASALPGRILVAEGDARDGERMRAIVDEIVATHGTLALAFLNVGTNIVDPANPWSATAGWATMEANVLSVANGLGPLIAVMKRQGKGQIAINASQSAWIGLPGLGYYGASKATLLHLAESLHPAMLKHGILVQVVLPGFVSTPLTAKMDSPMPFLITVEEASRRIVNGFARSGFKIAFPWPMSVVLLLLRLLPYPIVFTLVRTLAARVMPRIVGD